MLLDLPPELLMLILKYVSVGDLNCLVRCCKGLYRLIDPLDRVKLVETIDKWNNRVVYYTADGLRHGSYMVIKRGVACTRRRTYKFGKKHGESISYSLYGNCNTLYISRLCHYKDNLKDGPYTNYGFNNLTGMYPILKSTYIAGNLHGERIWYTQNSTGIKVSSIVSYICGKKHGMYIGYAYRGDIATVISYSYDKRHGIYITKASKDVYIHNYYRNDKKHGECITYQYIDNSLTSLSSISTSINTRSTTVNTINSSADARSLLTTIDHSVSIRSLSNANTINSSVSIRSTTVNIVKKENYYKDYKYGIYERYRRGILIESGCYNRNIKDGRWTIYRDGHKFKEYIWNYGVLLKSILYFDNGVIYKEQDGYCGSLRDGYLTTYYKSGELRSRYKYILGKKLLVVNRSRMKFVARDQ